MNKQFRQEYERVRKSIMDNKDLSALGKKKKLEEFEKVKREEARKNIHELIALAVVGVLSFQEAKQRAKAERAKAIIETDWTRLLYSSAKAKSSIEGLGLTAIKDKWQAVKESEDSYLIKAWRETLPGIIRTTEYKDITKEKPGLLEDIETIQTPEENEITDVEKDALASLYEIKAEAMELDKAFKNNGGIQRRVFRGIHLDNNKVEADFKLKNIVKSNGETVRETVEELIQRREDEYNKKASEIAEAMNSDIDKDFEDVTGSAG